MNFEEYRHSGRSRYSTFVGAIRHILQAALAQHGLEAHGVTGRAKDPDSLLKKLADRGIDPADQIDELIKDLAGCRIVFLTNSQVDAFNHTGALHDNFEVLDVNVHHPVPGTTTETRLFDSTNYLVRLKPDRLALAEYRDFEGLRAEIQIQTLLNHAWAEMGHDTIYKEPPLEHLGKRKMAEIGERMNKAMQDHLVPAGHDFDKIARDFRRLLQADAAVTGALEAIREPTDNNALEDAVENLADLILPHFDEPTAEYLKLLDTLIVAIERSRAFPITPVETDYGDYPGKSSRDVARHLAGMMRSFRYADPARTFHALVRLFGNAASDDERTIWFEVGGALASHNVEVWKRYGPAAQDVLLTELGNVDTHLLEAARPLLISMLGHVLSADVEGSTWRSDSVMLHQGSVMASDALAAIRAAAMDHLEAWLDQCTGDADRRPIINALRKAGTVPMRGNFNAELARIVLRDASRAERIVLNRAEKWGLELRRQCEVDALHIHYRFHALRPDLADKPEVLAEQEKLIDALLALRDMLNADLEFQQYKILIGHDTVRPGAWEDDPFDFEATDAWRREQYPAMIAQIDAASVMEWRGKLAGFVAAVGSDGGHLQPSRDFLATLSTEKPDVALLILADANDDQAPFVSPMLLALEKAGRADAVSALVDGWLGEGRFLWSIGVYLRFRPEPDVERLTQYAAKAIAHDHHSSVAAAATVAAIWYDRQADARLIDAVFLPATQHFIAQGISHWIHDFHAPRPGAIVGALDEAQSIVLLRSFADVCDIDYRAVRILVAIARHHPQAVIDFFGARVQRDRKQVDHRFDPVPFHANDLPEALSGHAELLLRSVRQWYEEEPRYHEYRGGRLFNHVFPKLGGQVAALLERLAREGSENDLKFILKTLATYEGDEQIYPICMEVVDRLEPGHKLLSRVSQVLGETGVLSGEFGQVEAYTERRDRISKWSDDPRPRVQAYAVARIQELEQSMAWEQRRAERDVAQRKRDWGEA